MQPILAASTSTICAQTTAHIRCLGRKVKAGCKGELADEDKKHNIILEMDFTQCAIMHARVLP